MQIKPNRKQSPNTRDVTNIRASIMLAVMVCIGFLIMGKVIYTQYGPRGEELRQRAEKISYARVPLEPFRGDILTHDGRLLATSVPEYQIRMDFGAPGIKEEDFHKHIDSLSYHFATLFGDKSKQEYKKMFEERYKNRKKNRYTKIAPRKVNYVEMKRISNFPLFSLGVNRSGFIAEQINRRLLPHGSLARRTIGYTNASGAKLGIEGAYDSLLRGKEGQVLMQKISGNLRLPVTDEFNRDPIDGIDVITTIDADIQDVAETTLKEQLLRGEADWGCAVLMEVGTGDIRAIANLTRHGNKVVEDFNYAMGTSLEPGSTIKLATLLTLLEDGASLDEVFDTENGTIKIGAATVRDSHKVGKVTLKRGFEESSNIVFALAANKYFGSRQAEYVERIKALGIAKPLSMQIKGEARPIIFTPADRSWNKTTLTNMAYGYALRITPLHTLCLYNAIANGGRMVRPRLVTTLIQYGDTIANYPISIMADNIVSKPTLRKAQQCLEDVVNNGTARLLKNNQYRVAAKTGTAQIAQGKTGYTDAHGGRHYLASLVGYFPADAPKYSCIVVIKTYSSPKKKNIYYGGSLAGPVFKALANRVYCSSIDWQQPIHSSNRETTTVRGGNLATTELCRQLGVSSRPSPHTVISDYSIEINSADSIAVMPNLIGLGLREALYLVEGRGLKANINGVGTVIKQQPAPNDTIARTTIVDIVLGNNNKTEKKHR